jgi:predicted DNA-binding transcriptional regulator AlpA
MTADEHVEITAAAIARLAGVGRAAVSNWRKRYPGFPRPIGGSPASPTFSQSEVETWLKATGKADQLATAGRTDTGTQRLSEPEELFRPWYEIPPVGMVVDEAERAVPDLTSGQLLARVAVSLLPRSTAAAHSVEPDAQMPVVLDPACSEATLLMAVADRFGAGVRLAGQEIDEDAAATAAVNLRADAHDLPYEIHAGDSLLDNRLSDYLGKAAAVVCEPPFDRPEWPSVKLTTDPRWEFGIPAPRDSELAWVQHCYAHLRPRGVAVVAVTPRTCVQPTGEHIRAALVGSGALRDVIALPGGMSSLPETDVYLWVLQRPYGNPDHTAVRMVDLSGLGDPADVPYEFAAWERLLNDGDPTVTRSVPRLELLGADANLLPSRWVSSHTEANAEDLADVTTRLEALYARISQGIPRFNAPRTQPRYSYVTLGELERAGALSIQPRDVTPKPGDLLVRTLGRPPVVATGTATDDIGVAQIVEIDDTRLDANFIATFLRADANALPVANTLGALSRDDLRRCRVPRLTLADQRRYGDAFRHLQELQDALTSLATVSANVIDQTIHGLTTGALAPEFARSTTADHADVPDGEKR